MTRRSRVLFASNGHGEDEIACKILDALCAEAGSTVLDLEAWPMVGHGHAYAARGISLSGPENLLPGEGFGTLTRVGLLRDLRAGLVGTCLHQLRHAVAIRGRYDLLLAIGDIMPLAAGWISRAPLAFVACAKSAYYGGHDGHNAAERWLMRRAAAIFPRDELTAGRLHDEGLPVRFLGNPMMDGLDPASPAPLCDVGRINIAMLPGSRRDATENALLLLAAGSELAGRDEDPERLCCLFAAHAAVDFHRVLSRLAPGWERGYRDKALPAGSDALCLRHDSGCKAVFIRGHFADVLHVSELAVGMAGTANEQAIGLGLPLVAVPGQGNQGPVFAKAKMRYFGEAAVAAPAEAAAIANAILPLLSDPLRRRRMEEAGRLRMGPPGASRAIARAVLELLEQGAAE